MAHEVSFQPSYDQFVLYDPRACYDPGEAPLWDSPVESDEGLSVGRARLTVSSWDEREWIVTCCINMEVFADPPAPPQRDWPTFIEASLVVDSGVLAVGDLMLMDTPELCVPVPPGRVRLRIVGQPDPEVALSYVVQVWPES